MQSDRLKLLLGLAQAQQWDKAWDEFERLKTIEPPSARMLLLGSHAAFRRRNLFEARHLTEGAIAAVSPDDPPELLGQVRFHLGMVARELGDGHAAHEQFQLFLSELSSLYPELSMGEGKAYFYLALTMRQRRDLEAAVEAYHKAIECFRRDELPSLLCPALQNLSWLLCHMQRPAEARRHLEAAAGLVTTAEDQVHQILGEAYLSAAAGDHAAAAHLCEHIFTRAAAGEQISTEAHSQAAWVAGTVALEQGNLQGAVDLVDLALNYATAARDARLINDANALRREVHVRKRAGA